MLTQASAATVAASSTAALPVSVDRNSRSGVCTVRAQAVVPESDREFAAEAMPGSMRAAARQSPARTWQRALGA